tara:strand:+ start:1561 stop:2952 length:1392 start_codon:yes stop_codon:yes gene_type:complete
LTKLNYDKGSFRDPAGKIFYYKNKVYREVFKSGLPRLSFLQKNNLLRELIEKKFLIKTEIIQSDEFSLSDKNNQIIEHEKLDFISYPYEWTFNQLKDAAIFHLNLQIFLLEKNAKLIDSSAYNIQFKNNKPIFIDVLSIDEYRNGEYWKGHKQFCENFLNPLILKSKKGIDFNNWFKGNLEGITTSEVNKVLSFKDYFSYTIFFHVYLLNKMDSKRISDPDKLNKKSKKVSKFSQKSYFSLLNQLKNYIKSLKPKKQISTWEKYSEKNTYSDSESIKKLEITKKFYNENNIAILADLGCNDGKFSEFVASKDIQVVGFDFDLNALDRLYLKSKKNNLNFLPLFSDFTNPSNNLGWNDSERKSLKDRAKFDASISLALVHHLVLAKNIPLDQTIEWIVSFSPIGLIEFVPKEDPTAQMMLSLKGDIFPDYNEKNFENTLLNFKKIKKKTKITSTNRIIYEFENK